jgi:hypothetical protein
MKKIEFLQKKALKLFYLKLALEKPFVNDAVVYFRKCINIIKKGGNSFDSIKPLLKKQQGRIINALLYKKKKGIDFIRIINDLFGSNEDIMQKTSMYFDKTTLKKYKLSFELARKQINDEGLLNPSHLVISKVAAKIFSNYTSGRVKELVVTETNELIENSRKKIIEGVQPALSEAIYDKDVDRLRDILDITESWNVQDILNRVEGTSEETELTDDERRDAFGAFHGQKKTWVTMGDDKVRETHDEANGQEQLIDDPFLVGGYLMQYPSDYSLGAPHGETCNCRCSSLF